MQAQLVLFCSSWLLALIVCSLLSPSLSLPLVRCVCHDGLALPRSSCFAVSLFLLSHPLSLSLSSSSLFLYSRTLPLLIFAVSGQSTSPTITPLKASIAEAEVEAFKSHNTTSPDCETFPFFRLLKVSVEAFSLLPLISAVALLSGFVLLLKFFLHFSSSCLL